MNITDNDQLSSESIKTKRGKYHFFNEHKFEMFGYRGIIYWFLVVSSFVNSEIHVDRDFCEKISVLPLCNCSTIKTVFCNNVNNSESNEIFIIFFLGSNFIIVNCMHEDIPSLEAFPDLTEYINTDIVHLKSCSVPMNRSLHDYTRKFSKNTKDLRLNIAGKDRDFNTNYFKRLSSLESLTVRVQRKTEFRLPLENVFEELVNLKYLTIYDLPTPNGIFDSLKQLQRLEIQNYDERRSDLQYDLFKNQRKLTELRLDGYSVNYFHPQLFANMTEIKTLKLRELSIESIPEYMLQQNHKLETFEMMNNVIKNSTLPCKLFAKKWNLETITLQSNNHDHLPEDLFENSTNITTITIKGNKLSSLPKNTFKDQTHLNLLDLSYNSLVNLTDGLFDSLTSLRVLILSHNKLSSLSK